MDSALFFLHLPRFEHSSRCWRNIPVTLKIPRLENQSVFDTWTLAKIVRKVEFKLLQIIVRAPGLLGVVPGYC
jgi:hypothetical protein